MGCVLRLERSGWNALLPLSSCSIMSATTCAARRDSGERRKYFLNWHIRTLSRFIEPWVLAQQVAGYRIVDTDISLRRRMISCQYAIDKDPLRPTQLQHLLEECLLRHDNAISLDISPMFAELIDMYDHENRATDRDEMIFRMLNHLETYGSSSQRVELEFRLELVDALLKHGHIDKAAIQVELAAEHFHNTQEAYTASHRMLSCLNRVRNALPPDCQQRIKLASYIKTIKSFSSRNPSEPN